LSAGVSCQTCEQIVSLLVFFVY